MPKVDVLTITGRKSGKINLPKEIFAAKVSEPLMAQAVRVYLANQRRAKAKVKTRGEVKGSGRKIWRQKGTGRARHGDRYAPIFVGGGRAHGPTGEEQYKLKMSKKMRRRALFSALTSKLKEGEILVVKGLEKVEPKTKEMVKVLEKLTKNWKLPALGEPTRPRPSRNEVGKARPGEIRNWKLTIILPGIVANVTRAARNIKGVSLAQASLLNTYEVLSGGKLILMDKSTGVIKDTFLGKANRKTAPLKR